MNSPDDKFAETAVPQPWLRVDGFIATARLRGDIDLDVVDHLHDVLADAMPSLRRMDLHLDQVTFMGSCGLNLLLRLQRSASANDATIRLCNPTPTIVKLLAVTALDRTFDVRSETTP